MDQMRQLGSPKLIKASSEWSPRPYSDLVVRSGYGRLAPVEASGRAQPLRSSDLPKHDLGRPLFAGPPPKTNAAAEVLR